MTIQPNVWLTEFLVNLGITTGTQSNPTITALNNGLLTKGNFLVTWTDNTNNVDGAAGTDIIGQIFSPTGQPIGGPFQINGFQVDNEREPSVAELSNGNIVVVYEDSESGGTAVRFSILRPDGVRIVSSTIEAPDSDTTQARDARVIALQNGNFAVIYEHVSTPNLLGVTTTSARVEVFSANGTALGVDVGGGLANSYALTQVAGGLTAVVTATNATGGTPSKISTIYFEADGSVETLVIGAEEFVAAAGVTFSDVSTVALVPTAAAPSNFRHVIVWVSNSGNNNDVLFGILDGGNLVRGATFATSDTENNNEPAVVALRDGGFFIAWDDDTNGFIEGRRYDRDGNAVGGIVRIASGQVAEPELSLASDGRILVAWTEFNGTDNDIRSLILDPRPVTSVVLGTEGRDVITAPLGGASIQGLGGADSIFGSAGNDRIDGGTGSDSILAGAGNDSILGGTGDDIIDAGAGHDRISGGDGADTIFGGTGNDTVDYSAGATGISINLSTGTGSGGQAQGDRLSGIEIVLGSQGGDTLVGNSAVNTLFGLGGSDFLRGGGGSDFLSGADGDDILEGGEGADTLNGGNGSDTADYFFSPSAVTIDLLAGTATGGDAGFDLLIMIENLGGSAHDDRLSGDNLANQLSGQAGNDTLAGRDGDDTLFGGAGNDELAGNADNDLLRGGVGRDVLAGGTGNDRLFGDEETDTLFGESGDDQLSGGDADDLLFGGDGNDTLAGDADRDFLAGEAGNDSLLGGLGADNLFGDSGNDRISGGDDDDLVAGGDDHDFLSGDGGNDSLFGGTGNDTLVGATGNDTLRGGDGDDIMGGDQEFLLPGQIDGNDTLLGEAGNDLLIGGGGNDLLDGGTGNDTLEGGDGRDRLDGGAGNDTLLGDDGTDVLLGGAGVDQLFGGAGKDTLNGGTGNDSLNGGADDDTYIFVLGDTIVELADGGIDTIRSNGTVLLDQISDQVENAELTSTLDRSLRGNALDNRLTGNAGANVIVAGAGDDTLDGGAGNDTLNGQAGADVFVFSGAFGQDRIQGFQLSVAGERIDLRGVAAIISFADLQANHLGSDGTGSAVITAGANTITLTGIAAGALTADDFLF